MTILLEPLAPPAIRSSVRVHPVMVCVGTRPEAIKLAPVIAAIERDPRVTPIVVATAQHRHMLDQMLDVFGIDPDVDLELMSECQTLHDLAGAAVESLGRTIAEHRPAAVVVQGDTTTALCAALASAYAEVPVAHVEAGLRTGDPTSPFPEELNRRMIGAIAALHFCPTAGSAKNLLAEGIDPTDIFVTGNTVVDALHGVRDRVMAGDACAALPPRTCERRLVVTMHRRETQGDAQRELLRMLARVVEDDEHLEVVLPVHLNPRVRGNVLRELGGHDRVHLTAPLDYLEFVELMHTADVLLSDSGGVQEEAPALGVPLLVMRDTTERPEGVAAGGVRLCGTDPAAVERELRAVLCDPDVALQMAAAPNPYGDGRAAERIVGVTAEHLEARCATEAIPLGNAAALDAVADETRSRS